METASTARPPRPRRRHRSDAQRAADRAALNRLGERAARVLLPLALAALLLGAWEVFVQVQRLPPSVLPAPSQALEALARHGGSLAPAWWFTARSTAAGLAAAALAGVLLAVGFALSKWVQMALAPLALALQLTPVVALAPLLLRQADLAPVAPAACVALVTLYPILAGTAAALRRTDAHLRDLYALYEASAWQRLRLLLAPTALPGFLGGLRVAAAIAPAAALAAELVAALAAGAAGSTVGPPGLGTRLLAAVQAGDAALLAATLILAVALAITCFGLAAALAQGLVGRWQARETARDSARDTARHAARAESPR